jgi:hypothetical protein
MMSRRTYSQYHISQYVQTQHFIYSVSAEQHVLAQWAIIRFARMEDKIQFIMEIEISVSCTDI